MGRPPGAQISISRWICGCILTKSLTQAFCASISLLNALVLFPLKRHHMTSTNISAAVANEDSTPVQKINHTGIKISYRSIKWHLHKRDGHFTQSWLSINAFTKRCRQRCTLASSTSSPARSSKNDFGRLCVMKRRSLGLRRTLSGV